MGIGRRLAQARNVRMQARDHQGRDSGRRHFDKDPFHPQSALATPPVTASRIDLRHLSD